MTNRSIGAKLVAAGFVVAAAAAAAISGATPAAAATKYGCEWPRVCFYKTKADWNDKKPTAAYQDMGAQSLGPQSKGAYAIYNSRNDDGALLIPKAGTEGAICLSGGQSTALILDPSDPAEYMVTINILDKKHCV